MKVKFYRVFGCIRYHFAFTEESLIRQGHDEEQIEMKEVDIPKNVLHSFVSDSDDIDRLLERLHEIYLEQSYQKRKEEKKGVLMDWYKGFLKENDNEC